MVRFFGVCSIAIDICVCMYANMLMLYGVVITGRLPAEVACMCVGVCSRGAYMLIWRWGLEIWDEYNNIVGCVFVVVWGCIWRVW